MMKAPFLLCAVLGMALAPPLQAEKPWAEILGPPEAELPAPQNGPVVWRTDFQAALQEARAADRPLFVTWRCLPCDQCSAFDKDVLEGGGELTPLLLQYVTVRMTDAAQLDFRYFPAEQYQDLDLSWWGYLMDPDGRILAIYGGKDHVSDATRISEASLVATLERVLLHYHDDRRSDWDIDGPLPDLSQITTTRELPGYSKMAADRPYLAEQACIHCHQVNDILRYPAIQAATFEPERDLQPWPLPENVGIIVDRDHGLLVTSVDPSSAAWKAGIREGDELAMAEGQKLFGQADFRGVLHRADAGDTLIPVAWKRGDDFGSGQLQLEEGWKKTIISWRKSVYDGVYGPYMGFFPLKGPNNGKGSMSFKPFMGKDMKTNEWYDDGLRPNHEIISINGHDDDMNPRELLTWFRMNHQEGDPLTLKVKDRNGVTTIRGKVPERK